MESVVTNVAGEMAGNSVPVSRFELATDTEIAQTGGSRPVSYGPLFITSAGHGQQDSAAHRICIPDGPPGRGLTTAGAA